MAKDKIKTFKIEENVVPYFFLFEVKLLIYGNFVFFYILSYAILSLNNKIAINPTDLKKNKDSIFSSTLFSPTFKLEENKVPLQWQC